MTPGAKQVTITRLGKQFRTIERIRDWFDWWIPQFEADFPNASLRMVQGTHTSIKTNPLSAGTHDEDNCFDILVSGSGASYPAVMEWLKEHGAWGWFRHTGSWADRSAWHIHFGMLPPGVSYASTPEGIGRALVGAGIVVGEYVDGGWTTSNPHQITTTSQIHDYLGDSLGLKGQHASGIDPTGRPKPLVIFDWPKYLRRKEDPMGELVKEIRALCKEYGVSRVYAARLLLASAAKDATGRRLNRINAGRTALYKLDDPKK